MFQILKKKKRLKIDLQFEKEKLKTVQRRGKHGSKIIVKPRNGTKLERKRKEKERKNEETVEEEIHFRIYIRKDFVRGLTLGRGVSRISL